MTGELPPPDAEPPPGLTYIAGMEAAELWATLVAGGYECDSVAGVEPHTTLGWVMSCQKLVPGMEIAVHARYWTMDHVQGISAFVLPNPLEGTVDPDLALGEATRFAGLDYEDSDRAGALRWLTSALNDAGCRELPCHEDIGGVRFGVQVGERGSRSIFLDGLSQVAD